MKTERATAKMLAYSNAAEFIRSHGEEGAQYQENYCCPLEMYFEEAKKVADILDKKAMAIKLKYGL